MGLARKYILDCTTGTPSGMSYTFITEEFSLLDAFSGITDVGTGTTFSYSGITDTELANLTEVDYDERVEDFLSYVGTGKLGEAAREVLLSGATYEEILCDLLTTTTTTLFNTKFDATVDDVIETSDGKYLICGTYLTYNGTSANRIIKLNTDGTIDNTFVYGTGFVGAAEDSLETSDGKYLINGAFTSYNGTLAGKIIKLNTDGTIDNTFVYGTGFAGFYADDVIETSDTKYLVGGRFTSYNGTGANSIIKLNTDGTIDNTFVYGTGFNLNGVDAVIETSDNKYLIGGFFSVYNGTGANKIIKLNTDGTIDNTFVYGTGFVGLYVDKIIETSDNKYLIVGNFSSYSGTSANGIVKLNTDGSIDNTFVYGTGFSIDYCNDVIETSDNKYLITGRFSSYNGTSANGIIKLNTDGTVDNSFVYGTGFGGTLDDGENVFETSDGKYIVGGRFTSYNGTIGNRIFKLNSDGSVIW